MSSKANRKSTADIIIIAIALSAVAAFYYFCGCPFRFFFGVPCPGCGMTRAFLSLIKLDFSSAFNYHPLIFIMPLIALYLIIRHFKGAFLGKKTEKLLAALVIAAFVAVYLIRLLGGSNVVHTDFQSSVLHKILSYIWGHFT